MTNELTSKTDLFESLVRGPGLALRIWMIHFVLGLLLFMTPFTAQAVSTACVAKMFSLSWPRSEDFYKALPDVLKNENLPPSTLAKKLTREEIEELVNFLMRPALNLDPTNVHFHPDDDFLTQKSVAAKIILYPLATVKYGASVLRRVDRIHGTQHLMNLGEYVLSNMPVAGDYRSEYLQTVLDFFRDDRTYKYAPILLLKNLSVNREALEEVGLELLVKDLSQRNFNPPVIQVMRALEKLKKRKLKLTLEEVTGLRAITSYANANLSTVASEMNIRIFDRLINSVSP